MRLEPGATLGRYQIRSALGAGGMGEVYLASDPVLGRPVALKVVAPGLEDADLLDRFEREACAASALNHPNIITIYEFAQDAGTRYIATEFVDGVTVRQRIARAGGPLELSDVIDIGRQIAAALGAAHAAGIVHRDLKPDNVMVRPDGYVKVLDFGLAKRVTTGPDTSGVQTALATTAGTIVGTVEYMSPEQVRGLPLDARTDVWSLGCVLYEMLTGRSPFEAPTRLDIVAAVLDREPVPLASARPDTPPALAGLVAKMLRKDRDERPQTMAEVSTELRQVTESPVVSAGIASPVAVPRRDRRILVASLACLVLVFALWIATRSRGSAPGTSANASRSDANSAGVVPAARSLEFWLDVQRMRDGHPFEAEFPSSGQEIFEKGWKFRLHARSPQAGHLYIVNEGPDVGGKTTFVLLFPASAEGTEPTLPAGSTIGTTWFVFTDQTGSDNLERFWIVSSPDRVPALEEARRFVNATDRGVIADPAIAGGVARLLHDTRRVPSRFTVDRVNKRTNVESPTPLLVHLVQLEHH